MSMDPLDPRITIEYAADRLVDILRAHGFANGMVDRRDAVIEMFRKNWPELRRAAHQLHNELEPQPKKPGGYLDEPPFPLGGPARDAIGEMVEAMIDNHVKPIAADLFGQISKLNDSLSYTASHAIARPEFDGLAAEVAKLQSGWSDVVRQLTSIRNRLSETEKRDDGLSGRLDRLETGIREEVEQGRRGIIHRIGKIEDKLDRFFVGSVSGG